MKKKVFLTFFIVVYSLCVPVEGRDWNDGREKFLKEQEEKDKEKFKDDPDKWEEIKKRYQIERERLKNKPKKR